MYTIVMDCLLLSTTLCAKMYHFIFFYNCHIYWSIFITFVPLETAMNTLQLLEIYLLIH